MYIMTQPSVLIFKRDQLLQVKRGPLAETSPMLNDISAVPTWSKVCYLSFVCHGNLLHVSQVHLSVCVVQAVKNCVTAVTAVAMAVFSLDYVRLRWRLHAVNLCAIFRQLPCTQDVEAICFLH